MSESAWLPEERRRERLPRLEDLPLAVDGYDRDAVRAAFDAFYRHAAELDATLRTLEAVDAFQRQAAELRSDIRALRAASWGPTAAARGEPWYLDYRRRARSGPEGAVLDALPRVAVETAFILLVAVGAFVAGVGTLLVVALIGAALAIVAGVEVVASVAEPRRRRRAALPPAPAHAAQPSPTVVAPPVESAGEAPLAQEPAGEEVEVAPEPEPAAKAPRRRFWRRRKEEKAPVEAPVPAEARVEEAEAEAGPPPPEAERVEGAEVGEREPAVAVGEEAPEAEPALEQERVEEEREPEPVEAAAGQPLDAWERSPEPEEGDELESPAPEPTAPEREPELPPAPQPVREAEAAAPQPEPQSEPEAADELELAEPEPEPRSSRLFFWRRSEPAPAVDEPLVPERSGHVNVISLPPAATAAEPPGDERGGERVRAPSYPRAPAQRLRRGRR